MSWCMVKIIKIHYTNFYHLNLLLKSFYPRTVNERPIFLDFSKPDPKKAGHLKVDDIFYFDQALKIPVFEKEVLKIFKKQKCTANYDPEFSHWSTQIPFKY